MTIADGQKMPQFYNQWVLQSVNISSVDPGNNRGMEQTEVNTWGFKPFKDVADPDLATSTDRPVHTRARTPSVK